MRDSVCSSPGRPDEKAFKALLHQYIGNLYGVVYSGLAIDIIKFVSDTPQNGIEIILRILSGDQDIILSTLATITNWQDSKCLIKTQACAPCLFLL